MQQKDQSYAHVRIQHRSTVTQHWPNALILRCSKSDSNYTSVRVRPTWWQQTNNHMMTTDARCVERYHTTVYRWKRPDTKNSRVIFNNWQVVESNVMLSAVLQVGENQVVLNTMMAQNKSGIETRSKLR